MKLKIYSLIISAVLLSSCTKWLDIQPSDTVSQDVMFSQTSGFRIALNGVYKLASSGTLYGRELTYGLMSNYGNDYINGSGGVGRYHPYYYLCRQFKYERREVRDVIDPIWNTAYRCIVNCNNLLGEIKDIEPAKFRLGQKEKDLIIGEALALRAMLHFDILRIYAPSVVKDDGKGYIPYYRQDGLTMGEAPAPTKQVLNYCVEDLKKAQELIAKFDTTEFSRKQMLNSHRRFTTENYYTIEEPDQFFASRGYRINFFAATALLARVYNYMGEHKLAFDEAERIINFDSESLGAPLFSFTEKKDVAEDIKTSTDLIFCFSDNKLYDNYEPYSRYIGSGQAYLALSEDFATVFDDPADYRYTDMVGSGNEDTKRSLKYLKPSSETNLSRTIAEALPIIRYSEMYYIEAEYYASLGNFPEAIKKIDFVRMGRNCTSGKISATDKESFQNEMLNEARREFIGEGQTYYYYKKFNIYPNKRMKDVDFYLPKPIEESVN